MLLIGRVIGEAFLRGLALGLELCGWWDVYGGGQSLILACRS